MPTVSDIESWGTKLEAVSNRGTKNKQLTVTNLGIMTQEEFLKQVWRPYDTVVLSSGIKATVTSVCFPTRSVKISISNNVNEWIDYEVIEKHERGGKFVTDEQVMKHQAERIEKMQAIIEFQNKKLGTGVADANSSTLAGIKKALNRIANDFEKVNSAITKVDPIIQSLTDLVKDVKLPEENKPDDIDEKIAQLKQELENIK